MPCNLMLHVSPQPCTRKPGPVRHVFDRVKRRAMTERSGDQMTSAVVRPETSSPARSRPSWPTYRRSSVRRWWGFDLSEMAATRWRWISWRGSFRCRGLKSSFSRALMKLARRSWSPGESHATPMSEHSCWRAVL